MIAAILTAVLLSSSQSAMSAPPAKPTVIAGRKLSPSQAAVLDLMNLVTSDADNIEIERAVKKDVTLGLNLLLGYAGLPSLGHAAYFGIGAYAAALATRHGALLPFALGLAPLIAAIAAAVFGWFCVRLSGVYLAMLTLAFGQLAWASDNRMPRAPDDESRLDSLLRSPDHVGKRTTAETARPLGTRGKSPVGRPRKALRAGEGATRQRKPLRGRESALRSPRHRHPIRGRIADTRPRDTQAARSRLLPTAIRTALPSTRCASNDARTSRGSSRVARPTSRGFGNVSSIAPSR